MNSLRSSVRAKGEEVQMLYQQDAKSIRQPFKIDITLAVFGNSGHSCVRERLVGARVFCSCPLGTGAQMES